MKKIAFKVVPQEVPEKMPLQIGAISMDVNIGGERYNLCFEQPAEAVVKLKLQQRGRVELKVNDIVIIRPSQSPSDALSNNKDLILNGQASDVLCDFSVSKRMHTLFGDRAGLFVEVCRGVWVNKRYIAGMTTGTTAPHYGLPCVELRYHAPDGTEKAELVPVSKRNLCKVKRTTNNIVSTHQK